MTKSNHIIPRELIQKKIKESLTIEEELFFTSWLSEKKEHQEFYQKARKYHEEGSHFDRNPIDHEEAWTKVSRRFEPRNRRFPNLLGLSASIAAAVAIVFGIAYLVYNQTVIQRINNTQELVINESITPGKSSAILVLDDGREYNLAESEEVELQSGGANIKLTGKSIAYSEESKKEAISFNSLIIPKGGEFFLELSDGTKVWLNSETTLKYPTSFAGDVRSVELSGEAYFEVAKNTEKPFLVTSGNHIVQVLGTQFNISAYKEDENIATTLVEGKVNIYDRYHPLGGQVLLPNNQSVLDKETMVISTREVNPSDFTAWKDGQFYFNNQSLDEIMTTLSRWYDIDVFYNNDLQRDVKFTGGFERYEDFNSVQRLIEKTGEVNFKINGKTVIID